MGRTMSADGGSGDGEAAVSLLLRERAGVREAACAAIAMERPDPVQERTVLAVSLTPALSRGEREKEPIRPSSACLIVTRRRA